MDRIWGHLLTDDERAALRPDPPDRLDRRPDLLVVGGGAVGLAVAVAARRAGLGRVVVLEREPALAAAASGANGGAIAPDMHRLTDPAEFVTFGRRSLSLYRQWDADWGGALGLWPTRWLNIFPPDAAPLVTRQAPEIAPTGDRPGFPMLDAAALTELEPDVRMPEGGTALLVDGQAGVNPQRLAGALAARAGQVLTGVAMTGVTTAGDRIRVVRTTAGDLTPGAVVVATGLVPAPWSDGVPQGWVKGHMVAVAPGPWRLGSVLAGPVAGGTPLPGGAVVAGGTFDDDSASVLRPERSDALARDLATVLPAAAGAVVTHRWFCFRPHIDGRQPVVDRLPGVTNGWFTGGHFTTGIMMAAATGEAAAAWIQSGRTPDLVRTFTLPIRRR
jgi:glycine/D-amino acid oxidase-like deaminating enzyme